MAEGGSDTKPPSPPQSSPAHEAASQPQSAGPSPAEQAQVKKARDYLDLAQKKMASSQTFMGKLFGGTTKMEEAADLYVRAGNSFKIAKRNRDAGMAFKQAAELHIRLDTKHEAATHLVEAAQAFKKADAQEAVTCYQSAIEIYTDMGRFSLAARYYSNVAEICEGELGDFEQAIRNYEQAADFYRGEDSVGSANKCLLKVAYMSAQLQDFEKAATLFEEIGRNSLENTLLKYAAKDYFFKAAICRFCRSPYEAREAVESYKQIHPGFDGTRELKLIMDLLVACEEEDTDKFADIVKDYDAISRIDPWMTAQLLHIKKKITAEPDIN